MNKINEVYETNDYSQFKFLNNNRDISTKHVNKLIKSMKEKRLISPILINESGQIIDGQHRFEAQKNLGFPVPYIVQKGYGEKEAQGLIIMLEQVKKIMLFIEHLRKSINLKTSNVLNYYQVIIIEICL